MITSMELLNRLVQLLGWILMLLVLGYPALAATTVEDQYREKIRLFNLDAKNAIEDDRQKTSKISFPDYPGCSIPGVLPKDGDPLYAMGADWFGDSFQLRVYRGACENNDQKAATYVKVKPNFASSPPFICSSSFSAIQNGKFFDSVKLTQTAGGASQCGDLSNETVFILEQWSFETKFDTDKAFTLVYAAKTNFFLNIDAYTVAEDIPEEVLDVIKEEAPEEVSMDLGWPRDGDNVVGLGMVQGYATAPSGIERVDMFIDGDFYSTVPYGAIRPDVAQAFPDHPNAINAGFSIRYGFRNLTAGAHELKFLAESKNGIFNEKSITINVQKYANDWAQPANVNVDSASCRLFGNTIAIDSLLVHGQAYDALLTWDTTLQSFSVRDVDSAN